MGKGFLVAAAVVIGAAALYFFTRKKDEGEGSSNVGVTVSGQAFKTLPPSAMNPNIANGPVFSSYARDGSVTTVQNGGVDIFNPRPAGDCGDPKKLFVPDESIGPGDGRCMTLEEAWIYAPAAAINWEMNNQPKPPAPTSPTINAQPGVPSKRKGTLSSYNG